MMRYETLLSGHSHRSPTRKPRIPCPDGGAVARCSRTAARADCARKTGNGMLPGRPPPRPPPPVPGVAVGLPRMDWASGIADRKSTRLNSRHDQNSDALFSLKKKKTDTNHQC